MRILIISLCKDKLSTFEFVKPLKSQLKKENFNVFEIDFRVLLRLKDKKKFVNSFDLIILSGTALKDYFYLYFWKQFSFLVGTKPKKLGICAGAQILALTRGLKLIRLKEKKIGQFIYKENNKIRKRFFLTSFLINYNGKIVISLKNKKFYLITYHLEVYNEIGKVVREFINEKSF